MDPRRQPSITGYRVEIHCHECGARIELKVPMREGVQAFLHRTQRKCGCGTVLVPNPPQPRTDD